MAFTAKLGEFLSRLANIVLGLGASLNLRGSGSITTQVPTISGTGTYTPPRYPLIQVTPVATGGGSAAASFPTLPQAGNFILVFAASNKDPTGISCADNQGNTYHLAAQSSGSFTGPCVIFYAYNIAAPSGTFTVTVSDPGSSGTLCYAEAYSGFGTNDPLYAAGTSGLNFPTSTPTASPATVNPTALGRRWCGRSLGKFAQSTSQARCGTSWSDRTPPQRLAASSEPPAPRARRGRPATT